MFQTAEPFFLNFFFSIVVIYVSYLLLRHVPMGILQS